MITVGCWSTVAHLVVVPLCLMVLTSVVCSQSCNLGQIQSCANNLINATHPITSLLLRDVTKLERFCRTDWPLFRTCYDAQTNCTKQQLTPLNTLNVTADYLCDGKTFSLVGRHGTCIGNILTSDRMKQCELTLYEHALSFTKTLNGSFCTDVVKFLTCVRWITWSSCGREGAELLHDVNKLLLDGAISTAECSLIGDEIPSGLAMSYVVNGYSILPDTPKLMRIYGDPKDWLPDHFKSGKTFLHASIRASSTRVRFGLLAADYWHNKLLWVDKVGATINELPLYFVGSINSRVVYGALSSDVRGVAVDWVTQTLYVADAGYKSITQVSYKPGNLGHHKVIIDTNLLRVNGVVTHPKLGKLFWSDAIRKVIESSDLNGENREILANTSIVPGTLAFDYTEDRLYLIGGYGTQISSCPLTGEECRVDIVNNNPSRRFSDFEVYESYIFVVVEKENMTVYNKTDYSKLGEIQYSTIDYRTRYRLGLNSVLGVTVSAPDKQYPYDNPCYFTNGGCQQLCREDRGQVEGRTCSCSLGYELGVDGASCVTDPFDDNFVLVADKFGHDIYMLDLTSQEIQAVPIPEDSSPTALSYIHHSKTIVWVDARSTYRLMRTPTNGSSTTVLVDFNRESVVETVYDVHSGYLYYSKFSTGQILKMNMATEPLTSTIIATSPKPVDIALDAGSKTMYWTDWGHGSLSRPAIYRANMVDGLNKTVIVSLSLTHPSGLAIDLRARQLFWCDTSRRTIESANFDGQNRQMLVTFPRERPYSIDLGDNYIYIVDIDSRQVKRYNRKSGSVENFGPPEIQRAQSIRWYNSTVEEYIHVVPSTSSGPEGPTTTQTRTTARTATPGTHTATSKTPPATQTTTTMATTPSKTAIGTSTLSKKSTTTTATTTPTPKTSKPIPTATPKPSTPPTAKVTPAPTTKSTTTTTTTTTPTPKTSKPIPTATPKPTMPTTAKVTPAPTTKLTATLPTSQTITANESTKPTTPRPTDRPTTTTTATSVKPQPPKMTSTATTLTHMNTGQGSKETTSELSSSSGVTSSGLHPGVTAAIVIVVILVVMAIASVVWYARSRGCSTILSRLFQSHASDDMVILEEAESPMSDPPIAVSAPPSSGNKQWKWLGNSDC